MKQLIALFAVVLLSACATMPPKTDPYIREYKPVGSAGYFAETSEIRVEYMPRTIAASFPVTIKNKTKEAVRIIWDESVFINGDGASERIMHSGVKIADRSLPSAPSLVAPGSSLQDIVMPISRVNWVYRGWEYSPICGTLPYMFTADAESLDPSKAEESACIGKKFGLLLTYEINGKKKSVTANFEYSGRRNKAPVTTKQ